MNQLLKNIYHSIQRLAIRGLLQVNHRQLDLSNYKSVVVVAPHPDDEIFGCGGVIMRLKRMGKSIKVVFLSRGEAIASNESEKEIVIAKRREIAIKALSMVGLSNNDIIWLNFPDGNFSKVMNSEVEKLFNFVNEISPSAIFFPHYMEYSPDHIIASKIMRSYIKENGYTGYEYCVWVWYHMPLNKVLKLKYKDAVLLPVIDLPLKKELVNMYSEANDGNGLYYSGKLPKLFLKAVKWNMELFFKV